MFLKYTHTHSLTHTLTHTQKPFSANREENWELYHDTLEQLNVMQATVQQVTQQRDELRQLHKDAQFKVSLEQAVSLKDEFFFSSSSLYPYSP